MEKIEVSARFIGEDMIIPLRFVWQGKTYRVDSIGRSWRADDGYHVLVMDHRNQAYHLLYVAENSDWYLIRGSRVKTVPLA